MSDFKPVVCYVNPLWRRARAIHTPLLNPWWGNPLTESSLFTKQLYDSFAGDTRYYTITDTLTTADVVLAPYPHVWYVRHDKHFFDTVVETARERGLPLLVDGTGDIEYPVAYDRAYVLRYGGYRFIKEKNRIQIPLFVDDLLIRCREGRQTYREKSAEKPVVGFAGWAKLSGGQLVRTILKELPVRLRGTIDSRYRACKKGVLVRQKALALLAHSPLVTLRQRSRSTFSGSAKTAEGGLRELREQMVETILESDYALDVRGDANNSARLFEILSLGRIPVIIDTERNFPFSGQIDYSAFALIVDFRDLHQLPERIAAFHHQISPERFKEMQQNARDAYVHFFRIDVATRLIMEEVRARCTQNGNE